MLLKFTVKAVKGAEIKQIEALQKKLADVARLNAVVGRSFEKTLRNHFRKQNRRPNKRGWRKQGVWNKIAADTAFAGADETSATVTIRNPIIKTKIFGARIKPKGGKKFDLEAFDKFDEMLFENFGEKLVTPKKLLDAAGVFDFDEFRAKNAYPTVESLKGKIIFLLHEKDSLETYMQRDPDMQKSAMNIALEYTTVLKKGKDYSRFSFTVVLNDPTKHKERIAQAINRDNFMVRTRLDRYAVVKEHWYKNGIESGANILSTDYTPHAKERIMEYPTKGKWTDTYYAILYEADKTVTLRGK